MRVILSKKGLDSSYGGYPIDLEKMLKLTNNKMIYIPMPMVENVDNKGKKYSEINTEFGNFDKLYKSIVRNDKDYKLKYKAEKLDADTAFCHPDPYILELYKNNSADLSSFGAGKTAASHLTSQGVGKGDLFLFYSSYLYKNKIIHAIWGYLEVGEVIRFDSINKEEKLKKLGEQPHKSVMGNNECKDIIYVAKEGNLSLNPKFPSSGLFTFSEKLILTNLTQTGYTARTLWRIPQLSNVVPSWNGGRAFNEWGELKVTPCAQEFVLPTKGTDGEGKVKKWAGSLFTGKNLQNT